ncbi:MAG: acetyl-CoA carboxylase carboxyl transferase subunit alpha, partial [Helicobacter sp.]|nr:acetyl-CoA carboxylase carboxyl transferase subunit alpha [Helicobacter sp.]
GALAISVADRLAMMEYSIFSVISPEGCAAILWNDPNKVENATEVLKITPESLKEANLIDAIIKEPQIGAHRDKEGAVQAILDYVSQSLQEIKKDSNYLQTRYKKLMAYGSFQ